MRLSLSCDPAKEKPKAKPSASGFHSGNLQRTDNGYIQLLAQIDLVGGLQLLAVRFAQHAHGWALHTSNVVRRNDAYLPCIQHHSRRYRVNANMLTECFHQL